MLVYFAIGYAAKLANHDAIGEKEIISSRIWYRIVSYSREKYSVIVDFIPLQPNEK